MPDGQQTLGNVEPIEIQEEMERSFLDYAMSVIVSRALPDARDGLKPVHRRILYGMYDSGLRPDRAHTKCAQTVGHVMGHYHPHGDSSIYDALARMVQDFSLRHPLIDGHGAFGSPDPESQPAAMRYTEARLAPIAMQLLADIDEDTVDMVPTYDGKDTEPAVLPARFPNLLVNGSQGIAVGMATNIPPHNLGEVIDATVHLIDDPEATNEDLMRARARAPTSPRARSSSGRGGIMDAYRTGRGSVKLRAVAEIEETRGGGERIVVTEIPFQTSVEGIERKIADLVNSPRHRGHPRDPQRVGEGQHPPRRRAAARRQRARHPQQPLQAHPAADELRREHARPRRRRAPHARPPGCAERLHRPPDRRHHPTHAVPPAEGARPGPHRRGPGEGARHDRRDRRPDPGLGRRRHRPRGPDGRPVRLQRDPGPPHPRHAAAAPRPARGPEAARRARRAHGDHRRARGDPRQRRQAPRRHQRPSSARCATSSRTSAARSSPSTPATSTPSTSSKTKRSSSCCRTRAT